MITYSVNGIAVDQQIEVWQIHFIKVFGDTDKRLPGLCSKYVLSERVYSLDMDKFCHFPSSLTSCVWVNLLLRIFVN